MSGADDQRAAEVPDDVARRWLAERDEARKLLAETRTSRDDMAHEREYLQEKLRRRHAELAETRAAGDALADRLDQINDGDIDGPTTRWRSLRGDARTVPAADVRDPASETHRTSAAPADDTAAPDPLTWPGVASAPGTSDRIVAEVKRRWPEHAALHREIHVPSPVRKGGNTEAVIELAVHVAISMLQQDPSIAGGSSPASTDGGEQ